MPRLPFLLSLALLAPALTGCLTPTPAARLYVLDPLDGPSTPALRLDQRLALGIGPSQVPEYLDRPELVVRAGPNEVSAVESDRWAERLPVTLSRVLTENLSRLLGVEAQLMQSGRAVGSLDYEIYLDITRFEIAPDGGAALGGRWIIIDANSRAEVASARLARQEKGTGTGFPAAVSSMNRAISAVSQDIAARLRTLPPRN